MDLNQHSSSKSLFITKNEEELVLVPNWCKVNGWQLNAHSFLSFDPIAFNSSTSFDVVFFASPRAAQFFLDFYTGIQSYAIAVAGDSTKKYVESRNLVVSFSPINGGDVTDSSRLFAQWVGDRTVLFPTSNISHKSYTKFLRPSQIEQQVVYKTQISTKKIDIQSIYVFTSPSNVTGFLESNVIPTNSKVIAWGETTANALNQQIPSASILMMHQSSEEELIQMIQ